MDASETQTALQDLTTEAVKNLPSYSPIHKRRALLTWLKEQEDKERKSDQDENMSMSEEDAVSLDDAELRDLSDSETTITVFSEEDETIYQALEACKALAEHVNIFTRHLIKFTNKCK